MCWTDITSVLTVAAVVAVVLTDVAGRQVRMALVAGRPEAADNAADATEASTTAVVMMVQAVRTRREKLCVTAKPELN